MARIMPWVRLKTLCNLTPSNFTCRKGVLEQEISFWKPSYSHSMLNFGGVIKSCAWWENLFTVTNDEVNIIIFQLWIDIPSGLQQRRNSCTLLMMILVIVLVMILVWKIKEWFLGFTLLQTSLSHTKILGQNFHNALSNLDSLHGSGRNWVWLRDPIWSVRVVHIKWFFMKLFIVPYIVDLHFDDRYLLVYLYIYIYHIPISFQTKHQQRLFWSLVPQPKQSNNPYMVPTLL